MMMTKPHLLALALGLATLATCMSCRTNVPSLRGGFLGHEPWSPGADDDAAYGQAVMRTAVKITQKIVVHLTGTPDSEDVSVMFSGSGNVVASRPGSSLVLTAGHVCKSPTPDPGVSIVSVKFRVINAFGDEFDAKVLSVSHAPVDLCVVEVSGIAGEVAPIADEPPPLAGRIVYAGAPHGIWGADAVPILDGRFSGRVFRKELGWFYLVSIAAAPGSSGSGIFYHGKIFGVLVRGDQSFAFGTLATTLDEVHLLVRRAIIKWSS